MGTTLVNFDIYFAVYLLIGFCLGMIFVKKVYYSFIILGVLKVIEALVICPCIPISESIINIFGDIVLGVMGISLGMLVTPVKKVHYIKTGKTYLHILLLTTGIIILLFIIILYIIYWSYTPTSTYPDIHYMIVLLFGWALSDNILYSLYYINSVFFIIGVTCIIFSLYFLKLYKKDSIINNIFIISMIVFDSYFSILSIIFTLYLYWHLSAVSIFYSIYFIIVTAMINISLFYYLYEKGEKILIIR